MITISGEACRSGPASIGTMVSYGMPACCNLLYHNVYRLSMLTRHWPAPCDNTRLQSIPQNQRIPGNKKTSGGNSLRGLCGSTDRSVWRQLDDEKAARAGVALDRNSPAVRFHDAVHDGQTQAAAVGAAAAAAVKPLEDVCVVP